MPIVIEERPMTDEEYKRELAAFDEHGSEFNNPPQREERMGFVATNDGEFVGSSSGLAHKVNNTYGKYFYLSDLLVEKSYRGQGYGKKLLELLEHKIRTHGVKYIWTWTAEYEYEGEVFYIKQGYEVFVRQKEFYSSGHARVGLIKTL